MKVHNDLKELLTEFVEVSPLIEYKPIEKVVSIIIDEFLEVNSLASSEPRPLAKNKQTEKGICSCNKDGYTVGEVYMNFCVDCKNMIQIP